MASSSDTDLSPTPATGTSLIAVPKPQFDSEQVEDEPAYARWQPWGWGDGLNIRLWNTCRQYIINVPYDWAVQANISTLADLSPIIDLMFETDSDTPLVWAKKALWDPSKCTGLLPLDSKLEPEDYIIYRSDYTVGLIPSCPWGLATAPTSESSSSAASSHSNNTAQSQSSNERARMSQFREEVLCRDGVECVLTGMKDNLQAARLVDRDDKTAYAATGNGTPILAADDTQAGITLYAPLHMMYDKYEAAFYPTVSEELVEKDGVKKLVKVTSFTFHVFRPPCLHPQDLNRAWATLIVGLHGQSRKWTRQPLPSAALARVWYQRALLKRFAVLRRTMPPPVPARKRAPSSPATPRSAKRTRSSTPEDADSEDFT